jgi:CDP-diacylglycerol--serine O-phosphatidyltransferase
LPDEWLIQPALFVVIPVFSAFMMNANIRLFSLKFKNLSWHDNQLRFAFLILCIGYLALFLFLGVSLILITYIVLSVIRNFAK